MCSDVIDVFFYLHFELFKRPKRTIVTYDVHNVDMDNRAVYISIKTDDVDFKMSFLDLIRTCSEKYFAIYRHSTGKCLVRENAIREDDICCSKANSMTASISVDNFANNWWKVDER